MNVPRLFSATTLLFAIAGCSSGGEAFVGTPVGAASASVNTTMLSFGTVPLGQTSTAQTVTVTNTGSGAGLAFSIAPAVKGTNPAAFLTSSACPVSLARNASCNISVAFAPTAAGAQTATLQLVDNATNSPQLIALSGTGNSSGPVVSLSSSALSFTRLPVGQASTQTVTLTDIGSYPLTLAGFTVGGVNATSFAVSGSCVTTATLATGASCFLTVTYAPTVAGAVSAIVNVNDNAPNAPQTVTLTSN